MNLYFAEILTYSALALGLVFPGIAHGALDNYLLLRPLKSYREKAAFYLSYLATMALVFLLWLASPALGLALFLLSSAWHFGQTDNLRYGIKTPLLHILHGMALLAYILLLHYEQTAYYLGFMQLSLPLVSAKYTSYAAFALLGLLVLSLGFFSTRRQKNLFFFLCLLLLISQVSLILGFALYFLLVHSLSGWLDIAKGLGQSHSSLLKKALPFTGMAVLFIASVLYWKGSDLARIDAYISWFFIALSCLSTPHILLMHRFYQQKSP